MMRHADARFRVRSLNPGTSYRRTTKKTKGRGQTPEASE